jgi:replicative DNA helicase
MSQPRDYSSILFTPEQIGNQTAAYLEMRKDNAALGLLVGLDSLDKMDNKGRILLPMLPGELMGIIARPGCGKTSWMVRWARYRSNQIKERGITDRAVVYVTLEQSIEELNAFNLAADKKISITKMAMGEISPDEWRECLKDGINRRFLPLWNIGYSSMTTNKQIRVDADAIRGTLQLITAEHGLKIDSVFIDYLQRMPYDRAESKTVGVSDNLDAVKTIALTQKCPVIIGVQARREVDDSTEKIPSLDDGQWTSNVEQTCDKVISLMRPCNYYQDNEMCLDHRVEGTGQMVVDILKQKLGPANFRRWVYFDPIYNKLEELETRASNAQAPGRAK